MYSHGSSARVGVGKSGHGGRNYRPPRPRRDPNTAPPPLKECYCLLQFQIQEYATPAAVRRNHDCFGGREALQDLEGQLRSQCLCHLVVPGRKQSGPVAIVGRTIQEALSAAAWLMRRLILPVLEQHVPGQIQRNVKDTRDAAIVGRWCVIIRPETEGTEEFVGPSWLFQSPQWNVMVCPIRIDDPTTSESSHNEMKEDIPSDSANMPINESDGSMEDDESSSLPLLSTMKACVDNVLFRLGNLQNLHMFVHEYPPMALALGKPEQATLLLEEIRQRLRNGS
jgi:hypothetical protein